jgi:hypothetical protein
VVAHSFLGAVAVEVFGGRVPGGDDPLQVLAENRVLTTADDLGQVAVEALVLGVGAH